MESPLAAKNIVGGFTADLESDSEIASPIQQQKTEHKSKAQSTDKDGSGIPVSPKMKYRVGNVINNQTHEDAKFDEKIQTKQPKGDPEPHKDGGANKKKKEPRTSLMENDTPRKGAKPELENSGLISARSDKNAKSGQKKSIENTSQVSWPLESGAPGTYDVYEKIMESKGTAENLQELEAENKMLRQFLKDLNDQLRHHVERAKITNYEGKKSEFKDKSPEEQIKTIIKELANNEKILAYNKEEHRKAEARLSVIKDSSYVFGIQKELMNVQAQINMIKKENKQLGLNTGNVGKDLDVIENVKGVPMNIEEAHEREKEAIKISQKLEALKQKNAGSLDEKKRKLEKEKTLSEKITKLERTVFGASYVSEDTLNKYQKIAKSAAAAEEDYKYSQKSYQFKVNQIARDLEELYMQQQKEREHVEKLEDVLQEQAIALKELIANEGSRLNRGAQDVLDQIRTSLEHEEKQKGDREKERSVTLLKNKSLEAVRALRTDLKVGPVNLNYSSSVKHKHAIKRELEEKKPTWKETNKGERARMEQNFEVPASKIKTEEAGEFSKPSRPVKVQKEQPVEKVQARKKSIVEEPKEETPKVVKKAEVSEKDSKAQKPAHSKPESKNGSPREHTGKPAKNTERNSDHVDSLREKEKEKEKTEKQNEVKKKEKETKDKKAANDFFDDLEDIGQLKEEINNYSHQIKKEVDKEKTKSPQKKQEKKPVQKEPEHADFDALSDKDEEHEGKVFELGQKKEKNLTNMKLDMSKAKKEDEEKEKEKKEKKEESPVKEKHDTESKRKEDPHSSVSRAKHETSPTKEKHEGEPKTKEDGHVSVSRTKQETPKKSKRVEKDDHKEDEGDREWEDNDYFASMNKSVSKIPEEKVTAPKKNVVEDNADFEEFNFDD